MKIKFLGTSAGWPLPWLGCRCEICTSKDPKDIRTRTQILVNDSILLDAGPNTYDHLKKEDPRKIKAVLVSHEHPDHIMGFWDLSHIYEGYHPTDVYVTLPVVHAIRRYIEGPNLKIHVVKPNLPFLIDHVKVEYFPVIHGKTPAYGIKLKENKIFIYITDFNRILPSQEKVVKHADYWAIDGSSLGKIGQSPSHISITNGIELAQKYKIKNTYFIHIGHKTGTHRNLKNFLAENASLPAGKAGRNFHAAFDGQEINI